MRYLTLLRAHYLATYFFVISTRPSRSYLFSLMIACASGFVSVFLVFFLLAFGKKVNQNIKTRFPFEAFLFHGLSYEEWRTADMVRGKMETNRQVTQGTSNLPEDVYLPVLLILSFAGLVEYRPQTPEERSEADIGKMPQEGEVLTTYTFDPTGANSELGQEEERSVSPDEAEVYAAMKRAHVRFVEQTRYGGSTLSRLVYDGVHIVFKRKKIGPKPPARTSAFMRAFGIAAN